MPDQTVELEFKDSGADALESKINAIAAALSKLPSKVNVGFTGTGGAGGGGNVYNHYQSFHQNNLAQQSYRIYQQTYSGRGAGSPANPGAIKASATAVATAALHSGNALKGLAQTIAGLSPAAGLAVGGLTALVGAAVQAQQRNYAAQTTDFLYGPGSGASARGISGATGQDFEAVARRIQDAMNSDPRVKGMAGAAGVNPSGDPTVGDTDYVGKARRMLSKYGNPRLTTDAEAKDFALRTGTEEQIAQLRGLSDANRDDVLNARVDINDRQKRAAGRREKQWNQAKAGAERGVAGAGGGLMDAIESMLSGRPNPGGYGFGPRFVGPDGKVHERPVNEDSAGSKIDRAADKMLRAANKMGTLADPGMAGGGRRSRNFLPPGFGYTDIHQAALGRAAALGVQ